MSPIADLEATIRFPRLHNLSLLGLGKYKLVLLILRGGSHTYPKDYRLQTQRGGSFLKTESLLTCKTFNILEIKATWAPLSVEPVARILGKVSKLTLLTQFRVKIEKNVENIEPENVKNVNFDTFTP